MRLTGKVVRKRFGAGSKSEHDAVVLATPTGNFKLRVPGGNPFQDTRLDAMVGKSIAADGEMDHEHGQFFLSNWKDVVEPDPE